jgi:NodT family efflux transporter outer membrane factor (OMF) lipoprotein
MQKVKTRFYLPIYLTGQKMRIQLNRSALDLRLATSGVSLICAALLSACANYAGIHSEQQTAPAKAYVTTKGIPAEGGHWPTIGWADQFGDAQLKSLLIEALKDSPSLDQARARVAAASAYTETAKSSTMPKIGADYSLTRQQYSGTALVPPPYAGSWQTENKLSATFSYDLDLWGKNRESLKAAVSQEQASEADAQVVKLTLTTSVARTYNQLARLYDLRAIAVREVAQRDQIERISASRIATGLNSAVELKTAQANVASSRAALSSTDGQILITRYQLGALVGAGPDRGLSLARPAMHGSQEVLLPDNLPADLVSRRPDLVAARWRVDALTHDVKEAKAEFYPDINLSAAIGLDAFGFGRFLTAASRTASAGPAVHLPIFDAGALRAQLKGRYADFDYAVATYNQTLVTALSEVATRLGEIRSTDTQLVDAINAQQAAHSAEEIAVTQYKAGLTNQLTVLNADMNALAADQAIVDLEMNRRDQQIELGAALGGGYVDTQTLDGVAANNFSAQAVAER